LAVLGYVTTGKTPKGGPMHKKYEGPIASFVSSIPCSSGALFTNGKDLNHFNSTIARRGNDGDIWICYHGWASVRVSNILNGVIRQHPNIDISLRGVRIIHHKPYLIFRDGSNIRFGLTEWVNATETAKVSRLVPMKMGEGDV
jgi:hypothetical protein